MTSTQRQRQKLAQGQGLKAAALPFPLSCSRQPMQFIELMLKHALPARHSAGGLSGFPGGRSYPLHSSPSLSLLSGDSTSKLRRITVASCPLAILLPRSIPIFQVGAHVKMSHVMLSYFSGTKMPLWSSRGQREGTKWSARSLSRGGFVSFERHLVRLQER